MIRVLGAVAIMMVATACGSGTDSMGHVHTVAVVEDAVLVGTHAGLWRVSEDAQPERVSADAWDVMGFAHVDGVFYGSGHPARGQTSPADLGLQVSNDGGRTWSGRSLVGDVDFHRLSAGGEIVAGISAHDGEVLISTDRGSTWRSAGRIRANDLTVLDEGVLVVAPERWWIHRDGELNEIPPALEQVATIATGPSGLLASTMDGGLWQAATWAGPWERIADLPGIATWLAIDGDLISAVVGDGVLISRDKAATFAAAILQ